MLKIHYIYSGTTMEATTGVAILTQESAVLAAALRKPSGDVQMSVFKAQGTEQFDVLCLQK